MHAQFDGFDDSSTLMSKEVAVAFLRNYMNPGFNCSKIFDMPYFNSSSQTILDIKKKSQSPTLDRLKEMREMEDRLQQQWDNVMWLSWGNSWMSSHCDWKEVLMNHARLRIAQPAVNCLLFKAAISHEYQHSARFSNETSTKTLPLPSVSLATFADCPSHSIIMHHSQAGELLIHEGLAKLTHLCDYMLLVDKVKEPRIMHILWNQTHSDGDLYSDNSASSGEKNTTDGRIANSEYVDLTSVFTHDGVLGWRHVLKNFRNASFSPFVANETQQSRYLHSVQHPTHRASHAHISYASLVAQKYLEGVSKYYFSKFS